MRNKARTSRTKLMTVFLFFLATVGVASAGAPGPKELWQKGIEYAGNNLYIDAVESYSRAIKANRGELPMSDVARIFSSRAAAYQHLNQPERAIDDLSNAIELDDKNPELFLNRGNAFLVGKRYEKARADFSAAIALDPRSAAAYAGRGKANLEERSYAASIADYRRAAELEPRNVAGLYGMGLAYRADRQDAKAIEAFNAVLKIDPRYAPASYQNAALFSRAGKIDSGCVWLEEAVANGFRDWDVLRNDPDLEALRRTNCYQQVLGSRR